MTEEIGQKVFQQVMDIWIIPEIERRKKSGKIDDRFILTRAQIVFSLDKGNEVRLNDEVKAIVEAKPNRSIKKGEVVYEKDLNDIQNIKLTDDDSNCSHITLLRFKDKWIVSFDARYDKELAKKHIEASKEFYETALDSLRKNRLRSFYENSFASSELSTKAILMLSINKKYLGNHGNRLKQMKNWGDLGNVDIKFSNTLNKLSKLRWSARYLFSDDFKKENPKKMIPLIKEMIDFAEKSIK